MISARNKIPGVVVEFEEKENIAEVKVKLTKKFYLECVITREAAEALNLKVGDPVTAIVKATEVMIEK